MAVTTYHLLKGRKGFGLLPGQIPMLASLIYELTDDTIYTCFLDFF